MTEELGLKGSLSSLRAVAPTLQEAFEPYAAVGHLHEL